MKAKLITILNMVAICLLMAACTSETDNAAKKLKEAIDAGKTEEVAETAAELYAKKAECSVDNLAQLAVGYNYLAEQEMNGANDPANLADYIEKAIDCFNTAEQLDAEAAKEAFSAAGKPNFKTDLDELKNRLQQAQMDEQALIDQINS